MASSNENNNNLETFCILWLDNEINNPENLAASVQLRSFINHLKTYENTNECLQMIRQMPEEDRVILIVSGSLGIKVVPDIHSLPQLSSVYVYCADKERNKQWADQYLKVKAVVVRLDDLIDRIQSDHKYRRIEEESLSTISIFNSSENHDLTSTGINGQFVHFQLLIDVLIRMERNEKDRQELIELCSKEYRDNRNELSTLKEFTNNYSSLKAVWWYTTESFIYRMLNKALRVQNIHLLFLFRFLIKDIYQQLDKNQSESIVHVFRGQFMSSEELEQLEKSVGKIISINSFFSTTLSEEKALEFVPDNSKQSNNQLEKVLFKITANPCIGSTKPFANVYNMSAFRDESEVLFMLGSLFQLNQVERNQGKDGQLTVIQMSLRGDVNDDFKKLYNYMQKQSGAEQTDLLSLSHVLRSSGKFKYAELYCHRFLKELSLVDPLRIDVYCELGAIHKCEEEYHKSLELYHKALESSIRICPSEHVTIANIHNSIGEVLWAKDEHIRALESFQQAASIMEKAKLGTHHNMALIQDNIGRAYENQENYCEAVVYYAKSLMIRQTCLPTDDPELALSFTNVGNMRLRLNTPDLASVHLKRALEIRKKKLPSKHPDIAISEKNLGDLYERQGKTELARDHFVQALEIQKCSLPSDHPNIAKMEKHLGDFYERHREYKLALDSFKKALKIYEKTNKYNQSENSENSVMVRIKQDIERVSKEV